MHREIMNLSTDSDTASEVPTVSAAPNANFMNTILTPMLSKEIDDLSGDSDSDFDDFSPEKVLSDGKSYFISEFRATKERYRCSSRRKDYSLRWTMSSLPR